MELMRHEDRMKKILITVVMVLLFGLGSWPETLEERQYVNLSITVWRLENGPVEADRRIQRPVDNQGFREG